MKTCKFSYWITVFIYVSVRAATATHAGEAADLPENLRLNPRSHPSMETLKGTSPYKDLNGISS